MTSGQDVCAERMLQIAWTVSQACADSKSAARRATKRVMARLDWAGQDDPDARTMRHLLIGSLASRFEARHPNRFRESVAAAIVADELALLTERDRNLLTVLSNGARIDDVVSATGLERDDVALAIRDSLRTLAEAARAELPDDDMAGPIPRQVRAGR